MKYEGVHLGDWVFYTGPSLASNSRIERGASCRVAGRKVSALSCGLGGGSSHRNYELVFFPKAFRRVSKMFFKKL